VFVAYYHFVSSVSNVLELIIFFLFSSSEKNFPFVFFEANGGGSALAHSFVLPKSSAWGRQI